MFSYAAAIDVWLRQVDRRRNVILALILVNLGVERAFGLVVNPAVIGILATWLMLGLVIGRLMTRVHDSQLRIRLRTFLVVASAVAVAFAQLLAGASVWAGNAAYFYLLAITAIALPARTLAAVTVLCTVTYGIPLFGEALGWWHPRAFAGAPLPAPTLGQAVATWTFMSLTLVSVSVILSGFVRLVRQAGEWHQLLVEQAPVMISTLDRAGQITAANPAADVAFGVQSGALVGRAMQDYFPDEGSTDEAGPNGAGANVQGQTGSSRFDLVLSGNPVQFETRMRRADGVQRWVDVVAHPLARGGPNDARDVLCLLRDVTDARAAAEALERQAYHDSLTGLANRARFAKRLDEALARAGNAGDPSRVAVLMLDLDGFKTVNDSLGHAAGDALLVEVAARLLDATRGSDTVARLGGDEFAVLLERVSDDADAVTVGERILATIRAPITVEGRQTFVGTSIGIARCGAVGASNAAALLRDADAAMYRAKAQGKGRCAVFAPDMHAAALGKLALAADLRHALAREELVLHFQPIVALDSGRAVGAEALVRWQHPERGLVSPNEFIPFAEETGLIVPLGQWVLGEACRQAAVWRAAGVTAPDGGPVGIAVNVSGQQIERADFIGAVQRVLTETGLPPRALTLEITEYSVVERPDVMRERLTELRACGVEVAIDDFGMGYSALGHLQQFPLDVLKIDRTFVDRVTRGGSPAAVTRTLVTLGEALSLRTVAEGIETEAQRAHLAGLGCRYGQGYLFARPLAAPAATAWLASNAGVGEPDVARAPVLAAAA